MINIYACVFRINSRRPIKISFVKRLKHNSVSLIFKHFYTINGKAQLTQKSYGHSFQQASSSWGTQDTIS